MPACSIPNPFLVAMCQGEGASDGSVGSHRCLNVGANRHFVYQVKMDEKYGVTTESQRVFCPRCCPACRAKEKLIQ